MDNKRTRRFERRKYMIENIFNWIIENWLLIAFIVISPVLAIGNRIIGKR